MLPSLSLLDLLLGNKTEVCGIFGIFSIFKLKGETTSSLNSIFYFSIVCSTSILSISYLVIYSFIHLFIYSFIHLFIYSFIHLFIYSFIHLFILNIQNTCNTYLGGGLLLT